MVRDLVYCKRQQFLLMVEGVNRANNVAVQSGGRPVPEPTVFCLDISPYPFLLVLATPPTGPGGGASVTCQQGEGQPPMGVHPLTKKELSFFSQHKVRVVEVPWVVPPGKCCMVVPRKNQHRRDLLAVK
jgi:hypothetical protein